MLQWIALPADAVDGKHPRRRVRLRPALADDTSLDDSAKRSAIISASCSRAWSGSEEGWWIAQRAAKKDEKKEKKRPEMNRTRTRKIPGNLRTWRVCLPLAKERFMIQAYAAHNPKAVSSASSTIPARSAPISRDRRHRLRLCHSDLS